MHRPPEFSFPGSPSRGPLPPRLPATHPIDDEEARWLQASLQASPDPAYYTYSPTAGGSASGSGSGTSSPQLWAQSHHHRQHPASPSRDRAQAIAGYRREMLDLVRGLPESTFELSLRDIVEHHRPSSSPPPSPPRRSPPPPSATAGRPHHASRGAVPVPAGAHAQEKEKMDEPAAGAGKELAVVAAAATDAEDGSCGGKHGGGSRGKQGRRKQGTVMRKQRSRSMERSVSLDTGRLIKLFLPLSIGGRKKKVSPKPDVGKKLKQGKNKKKKEAVPPPAPEEWWSKSEFSEAGSSSRTSSTGSSNSNSSGAASVRNGGNGGANPRAPVRSRSRKRTGCYAFFRANKGKNGVNQY